MDCRLDCPQRDFLFDFSNETVPFHSSSNGKFYIKGFPSSDLHRSANRHKGKSEEVRAPHHIQEDPLVVTVLKF